MAQKPIAAPWQCLDVTGMLGRVAEGVPEPGYRSVQIIIKLDENALRPEAMAQFVAADYFPDSFQQNSKDLERLIGQLQFDSALAKVPGTQVNLIIAKPNNAGRWRWMYHGRRLPFSRTSLADEIRDRNTLTPE
ncbi:MAG: hypothetical protein M1570_06840 [Chloroflexi bacterium]|nr:hypothetical protein [Chloroflexota bacterium]